MPNINSVPGDASIPGVQVVRATRTQCPVCGHPTSDCTTDGAAPLKVLGPGLFPSLPHEETYIVVDDIWEERQISTYTTTKVLVYPKGSSIPMSEARRFGLL